MITDESIYPITSKTTTTLSSTCDGLRLTAYGFSVHIFRRFAQVLPSTRFPPEPASLPTLRYLHLTGRSYMSISQGLDNFRVDFLSVE